MKIEKISNLSFGYNSLANAELINLLESQKKNKAYYAYIKEIVNATNNAEKNLRKAETKGMLNLMSLLIASFLPIKNLVTNMVEYLFPKLDYRKKEIEAYSDEIEQREDIKQNDSHWINTIVEVLKEHEAQDEADKMAEVLSTVMHEVFPNQKFDFSNLSPMFKQQYINNDEDDVDTEFDDDIKEARALQERIKLGKESVFEYEPETKQEKMGFASMGGMQELKNILMNKIVIPLKDIKQARYNEEHYGIKMPNGILFYGPPGTGKTTIVERLSVEAGVPLLELTTDSYGSEFINGSEKNLGAVFDYAASIATEEKPVILFIDDVDAIVGSRSSGQMPQHKKSELGVFLRRIQNAHKNNIIVMAATNCYDNIDKAVLRRLRQQIYVGLPDSESRRSIIKLMLNSTDNGKKLANDENAVNKIVELTDSFPISALEDFANDAREQAHIDLYHTRDIELKDFEEIIAKPESQNKKEREDNYKTKATRVSIGFNIPSKK